MAKITNIPSRLHSVEQGNIVAGANEIYDDTKGKRQNVINSETDAELLRLEQTKQDNLTFDKVPTENSTDPVWSGGVYAADSALQQAIEAILLLIPSAATSLNQLADKAFVNSSISTATATFRGTYNVVTDLHLAVDATHAQIETALASVVATADNNDYCYVQIPVSSSSQDIQKTSRYKFNGTAWVFEYDLNTSGFTSAQWAAINSGITAALVTKLGDLPTATELSTDLQALSTAIGNEETRAKGVEQGLSTAVQGILKLIPSAAASSNKLTDKAYVDGLIQAITALIPAEATDQNQLADKAYVLAQILAATPAFKGQFTTLAELQAVSSPKAGDIGIVRTIDNDGFAVFTFYQYLNNLWNVYYTLAHHLQNKPATTGITGDYPYNGMGRVVLPMNIKEIGGVTANYLEQSMMPTATGGNAIYVITHDYVLATDITIPANCVLEFEGGSVSGSYTITGNNSLYVGTKNIFKGILLQGTWLNTNIYDTIFDNSAYTDSYKIIQSINALINENIYQEIIITRDYLVKFNIDFPHNAFEVGSNTKFSVLGTLTAETNDWGYYTIIFCEGKNIEICGGGTIIGDVETHTGSVGEWAFGVALNGCKKSSVHDLTILKCWGDCLNISGNAAPDYLDFTNASTDIIVYNVKCDSGRRQGMSITYAKNVIVENCSFINTGQIVSTPPARGIDIEPNDNNSWKQAVEDVVIRNCYFSNNYNGAIAVQSGNSNYLKRVTIDNCTIINEGISVNNGQNIKILNTADFTFGMRGVLNENGPIDVLIDNCKVKSFYFEGYEDDAILNLTVQNSIIDNPSPVKNNYKFKDYVKLLNCVCNNIPSTTNPAEFIAMDCIFDYPSEQGNQPTLNGNVYMRNCKFGGTYRINLSNHISFIDCEFNNEYQNGVFTLKNGGDLIEIRNCIFQKDTTPIFFWQVQGDWSQGTLIVEGIFNSSQTIQVDQSFATFNNRMVIV